MTPILKFFKQYTLLALLIIVLSGAKQHNLDAVETGFSVNLGGGPAAVPFMGWPGLGLGMAIYGEYFSMNITGVFAGPITFGFGGADYTSFGAIEATLSPAHRIFKWLGYGIKLRSFSGTRVYKESYYMESTSLLTWEKETDEKYVSSSVTLRESEIGPVLRFVLSAPNLEKDSTTGVCLEIGYLFPMEVFEHSISNDTKEEEYNKYALKRAYEQAQNSSLVDHTRFYLAIKVDVFEKPKKSKEFKNDKSNSDQPTPPEPKDK